jgi:hypothetical protein
MYLNSRRWLVWQGGLGVALSLILLVPAQAAVTAVQAPPTKGVAEFAELVQFFSGKWHCAGYFANGQPIMSDESFGSLLGGAWLQQIHDDEPPMGYHAYSNWGVDRKSGALVVTILDIAGGLRLFASENWTPKMIVLIATPLVGRTGVRERFIYDRKSATDFDVEYQVEAKSGDWKLGDQLSCERKI